MKCMNCANPINPGCIECPYCHRSPYRIEAGGPDTWVDKALLWGIIVIIVSCSCCLPWWFGFWK